MDLEKPVGIYRVKDKRTAPSTSTVTFVGPKVGRGKIAQITFSSIINYTSSRETVIIGIRDDAGKDHYIRRSKENDPEGCVLGGIVYLYEGDQLIGVCPTPSASDVLYFNAHGLIYKIN